MSEKVKIGLIGLGMRGRLLLRDVILGMEQFEVVAVCDKYEDRVEEIANMVKEKCAYMPMKFEDAQALIGCNDVDAVLITCAWEDHIPLAILAMEAGKAVGLEVGGAYSIEQCWELVRTHERTKTPFMFLENCCYGRRELMALEMTEQGVLGNIVHCKGAYNHDLRDEVAEGAENRHYRLRNYLNRNCENYPTHELGPIAKILNVNRGNRMVTLNSIASKAEGLREFTKGNQAFAEQEFAQGDVVTTVIRCAGGETITLVLNTTLPRYYSRDFTVCGTKGMYEEVTDSVFINEVHREFDFKWKEQWGNAKEYEEQYEHPIWKRYLKEGVKGSHDGMDWLVLRAFAEYVQKKTECPIDVYDAAAWMSISVLSEQSIQLGGQTVCIPDFTEGKWMNRS